MINQVVPSSGEQPSNTPIVDATEFFTGSSPDECEMAVRSEVARKLEVQLAEKDKELEALKAKLTEVNKELKEAEGVIWRVFPDKTSSDPLKDMGETYFHAYYRVLQQVGTQARENEEIIEKLATLHGCDKTLLVLWCEAEVEAHKKTKDQLVQANNRANKAEAQGDKAVARAQAVGNGLYDAIANKLSPYFPPDTRELDWDVLPSTIGGIVVEREALKAQLAQSIVERTESEAIHAAVWDRLQQIAPWGESNDMDYLDEIETAFSAIEQDQVRLKELETQLAQKDKDLEAVVAKAQQDVELRDELWHEDYQKIRDELTNTQRQLTEANKKLESFTFWGRVYPEGMTLQDIQNELHDFHIMMENVPIVYNHVAGLSKPLTDASRIINAYEEQLRKICDEAVAEETEELKAQLADIQQHTVCACCGEDRHTPLRRDHMGGYVCIRCIEKELDNKLEVEAQLVEARKALAYLDDNYNGEFIKLPNYIQAAIDTAIKERQ
jgi:hypothetical protein